MSRRLHRPRGLLSSRAPMDFPKPPGADKRVNLSLPSKSGLIVQLEQREAAVKMREEELRELEQRLHDKQEADEARQNELENKARALMEGEMLLKNQRMLHQKQLAQLMEQKELAALRLELDTREDAIAKKEAFLAQTEKRLNEQLSAREADLAKREAWVSAQHEKASLGQNRRLQAIVFTDVVSYSALMQADEAGTIQRVRADLQRMTEEGKAQGGMLINTMGDGMVMIFPSAIQAVRFSLGMQRAFNRVKEGEGLRHRFGIHIADVALLPDGGIAGDGVNIASRLESKAPIGGICISEIVYFIVKGKLPMPPSSSEEIALKNITEPVAVYKFAAETIAAMPETDGSAPPQALLPEEERTAPPFAFSAPGSSDSAPAQP